MFIEILLFILLGIFIGTLTGLIPGIHPNMIILIIPVLASFGIETIPLISFIVAMGVTNSIVYFIPSLFLGIPDSGNELSILPGHEMILKGFGHQAIKLTVIGGLGAVLLSVFLMPIIFFIIPILYENIIPYMHFVLILIVFIMLLSEDKKILSFVVFILAGFIGLFSQKLPIDNSLLLFPIFAGLFGISMLLLQLDRNVKIPKQKESEEFVSSILINRSIVSGSVGGIISGVLPGVGSSEIASLFSVDKSKQSFLISIGAITTSNIILSVISLWLIDRARSGLAIALDQIISIGFNEVLLIIFVSIISVGIASIITLILSKNLLYSIAQINYSRISLFVIIFILFIAFLFTGIYGLLLMIVCTSLGIFTNLMNIKRGLLMGVLILPTILFYAQL